MSKTIETLTCGPLKWSSDLALVADGLFGKSQREPEYATAFVQ